MVVPLGVIKQGTATGGSNPIHRLLEVELTAADCERGPHRQDSVAKSDLVVAEDTLSLVGSKGV